MQHNGHNVKFNVKLKITSSIDQTTAQGSAQRYNKIQHGYYNSGYFFFFFLRFDPLGLYLLQHMFYIVHTDTFSVKLSIDLHVWMFPHGDVDHGHL